MVDGEWLAVFVGEVEEAVRLGNLFQPVDEGFHLGADDLLCASETDADNYEGHVGDSEMAFGAFPQAELNGTVLAKVVDAGSDGVPVESGIIVVAAEYFCDIYAKVLSANLGCIRQCSSKLGFALIGTRIPGRGPRWHRGLKM